ncbi:mucin-2-like [Macrosteles quadrilineatus]|uniref:mucin-2-like n=1 Tax=Macrosteles quadrilineatus TaxID=74068 RepID=UPI0023E2CED4|nr:mucin-2-like [Macrosteles quadrilineatus]
MGEFVDFIDTYRKFFERFTSTVDPSDQLPVKVAGYNLVECEIPGAIGDWSLQYLEQRKCPPFLIAHLIRKVIEEVRALSKVDPISCGFRAEVGDYLSLKLMQICITKLVEVCARYRDNAELSTLPPPHPLLPVTSCAIKNSRRSMEDRHVVIHDFHTLFNIKGWGPASYYGVLDGHNGVDAAIYSVSHLHQYLAESPHYPANPVKALHDACCRTDNMFTIKAERENLHGGTTAVVALLRHKEGKLYVAWLGDSQAVLVRNGRPLEIVRPHKPDRPDEKDRIEGMGGTVLYWGTWRVNGQLAVSRAIGDVEYKPYVTAEPDIEEITLDGSEDFLILGCDGLWDFVSEQQATDAVFAQLRDNPEDLEAVSERLVALSKKQSSTDNISVVVVFLTDPAELAKRPPMETPINPFNGEMFNGQHHRAPAPGPGHYDDEDFGPETDVDMVDDVLLSPAIAAAKALVHGHDDDFERQRQQSKEFDDPVDVDRSRDTPTPPAHEVARDASGDNLAESGGEESEEEWNYIPGEDTDNQASALSKQEEEDMNSQLNPDAAEFVPVSPKRLIDAPSSPILASSPARGFEKTLDNVPLPPEFEFNSEISQRPSSLGCPNGPSLGENCLDNFSVLLDKIEEVNPLPISSELASETIVNFGDNIQESAPFDKFAALQKMEEKVSSAVLEKANIFGMNNDFSNNAFESTNIFSNRDPMTASFMGNDLPLSADAEEFQVPGTPRSTTVEAPTSPTTDEIPSKIHQTDLDSPADDFVIDTQKSPDLISPGDGPQEGLISAQERTSSSGFESESGADDVVNSEGFVNEHRRSPTDMSFKPIETVSNTNPFFNPDSSQQFEVPVDTPLETPKKDVEAEKHGDEFDFMQNIPSSFVSPRCDSDSANIVPFDQLESPKDIPNFTPAPNADSSFLATELPKTPEIPSVFENISPATSETTNYKTNVNDITQNLFSDLSNPGSEETSFALAKPLSDSDFEGFLATESKITQDEQECEQSSKLDKELNISSDLVEDNSAVISPISPKAVDQVLAAFDDIKLDGKEIESTHELLEPSKEFNTDVETKEMELELESRITNSQTTPEELNNVDEGFEVINKDELTQPQEIITPTEQNAERQELPVDLQNNSNDFFSTVDQFNSALDENVIQSQNVHELSSPLEPHPQIVETEATKTVSYQTLTPANEPQITKSESYVTGEEEMAKDSVLDVFAPEVSALTESAPPTEEKEVIEKDEATAVESELPIIVEPAVKSEPVQSTVVTETLITNLEETSEVPTTEVPSSAGTPPPTPAPELDDSKEAQDTPKTDILVAAVAAAGAVAAGSAIVAEKVANKTKEVTSKKPAVGAKKPDTTAKSQVKSATAKAAPPAKSAGMKTTTATTKTTAAGPKPAASKLAPAKPSAPSTMAKKPTTASAPKPPATKPTSSISSKPTTTTLKQVPKQLPINKSTSSTLSTRSTSKPSTPNSKPTTPTTLKAPSVKSDATKSPARPGVKSPLTNKTLAAKPATDKVAEKKPLTNGDHKPLPRKTEVPKKPTTTTLTKPPVTKPAPTSKPLAPTRTATNKLSPATTAKPKPPSATAPKPAPLAAKRPSTAPAGRTMNGVKQVTNTKPLLNGRSTTAKTGVAKKTDPKQNEKSEIKPPPIKKPEELKKEEEKPMQIQEADVTTTNGFADHAESVNGLKIEDLAPTTVDTVN